MSNKKKIAQLNQTLAVTAISAIGLDTGMRAGAARLKEWHDAGKSSVLVVQGKGVGDGAPRPGDGSDIEGVMLRYKGDWGSAIQLREKLKLAAASGARH